ncbi:hypothetical protein DPMN_079727 [Dreissena polymorpha]|uniref:Uncharacterized protein n=1 Tax=Dreissena polymorpha TaxID=45954 RepID=A0A9D3YV03_DREPO|nr:hypothetical protein DPMN_079727 [Dreissena polymorpha]
MARNRGKILQYNDHDIEQALNAVKAGDYTKSSINIEFTKKHSWRSNFWSFRCETTPRLWKSQLK